MRRFTFSLALACAFAVLPALAARARRPLHGQRRPCRRQRRVGLDRPAGRDRARQAQGLGDALPPAWWVRRIGASSRNLTTPRCSASSAASPSRTRSARRRGTSADVTYVFSPESVQRALSGVAVVLTATAPRRILLVPFAPNYSRSSMWTSSFAGTRYASSARAVRGPGGREPRGRVLRHGQLERRRARRGAHPCERSGVGAGRRRTARP